MSPALPLVALVLFFAACAGEPARAAGPASGAPAAVTKQEARMDRDAMDLLVALEASTTFTPASVTRALHVSLAVEPNANEYIVFYEGRPSAPGPVAKVDLRVPSAANDGGGGAYLRIELAAGCHLRRADVVAQFGPPTSLAPPSPHDSTPDYAVLYTYVREGRTMNVAIGPDPAEKIVSVSFDHLVVHR